MNKGALRKSLELSKKEYIYSVILLLLWLCINIVIFIHFGEARYGGDTERYLVAAEKLKNGELPNNTTITYIGYILLIVLIRLLGLGYFALVIIQLTFSLIAVLCVNYITYKLSKSTASAFIASLMYVFFIDIQRWNFYILTESLFISCILISIALIIKQTSWPIKVLTGFFVMWTMLLRPHGIILLLPILFYIYFSGRHSLNRKILFIILPVLVLMIIAIFIMKEDSYTILSTYKNGQVIWGHEQSKIRRTNVLFCFQVMV